jgi:formate dehydrogenase major subunit
MLRVTIDGATHEFDGEQSILDAAGTIGTEIPAVCHDPRVAPTGACRVCVVRVSGSERPVSACTTPIADGMAVETSGPELESLRAELVRMLARSCPGATHRASHDDAFADLLRRYQVAPVESAPDPMLVDDSHPYLAVDMNRCIACFRCVRICAELQGQFTWRIWERGAATRVAPESGSTLLASSCVSCGACVDTCPTGALEDRTVVDRGWPDHWTRTVCPYCGVGCELDVGTRGKRIVTARPVLDAPVSKGHLCVKGRYAHGFVHADDRVTSPMVRRRTGWEEVSWREAIDEATRTFRTVLDAHGPSGVGVLGSARATNEDNYVAQKFARVALGTNNIDCCARVCHAPSAAALITTLGTGAATSSFDDIEKAETILVCGANATENHPIVGARIKQAVLSGAHLVVIDPRSIELADYADVHLAIRPGANIAVLNAMAHVIVDEDLVDHDFVAERVDGFDELRAFLAEYAPESVAPACGVEADDIRTAARMYAGASSAISFHGLGITEHRHGTDMVKCLVNLALLTGHVGKPGTGVNPLRGQNNVQGAAHMGCEPHRLTGYVPLDDGRARFEAVWGAPVPVAEGFDAMEMIEAARHGDMKALWVIGWDIALTNPDIDATRRALSTLDVVIIQDLFLNETARECGTVFLPACSTFERDGTFMNSERRVQRVHAAIDPIGASRPDWEILVLAAHAMGHADRFAYPSVESVWEEIRRVWPAGAGITYARLAAEHGVQWPCPDEDHPGTAMLHAESFPRPGGRALLAAVADEDSPDATPNDKYPFLLVTGRDLYQFNARTMTGRTANIILRPTDTLELSPNDARALGVREGDDVVVRSRYGSTVLVAEVTERVRAGVVFATFSDPARLVNRVTGPHHDRDTHTPEYKLTTVDVRRAST